MNTSKRHSIKKTRDAPKTRAKKSGLEASFGAWKGRTDIKDSASWVSKMRKQWSTRYGNDIFK